LNSIPILKFASAQPGAAETELRQQLAAVFRLAVWNDWHEAVANHFSVAVSDDGKQFLINPKWKHFARIRASDLVLLDADDPNTMSRDDAPDPTAWAIHGRLHAVNPAARCVLHVHSAYATTLACLADPSIKPIDQNTARFFNRVAIDCEFGGMADDDGEASHIAATLADKNALIMANHGVLVTGATVPEAFDRLYHLEKSCKTLVLAYSTHQKLKILSDDIAEKTARQWEQYEESAYTHFAEMRALLDAAEPDYRE
jgi:ribulose-5-phosphate 4-epimerase/fuculose-1-phosphate aldolase